MQINGTHYRTVWAEAALVKMIDQKVLPHIFRIAELPTYRETAEAIRQMTIRGAGAIGGAGGYGMAQVVREAPDTRDFMKAVERGAEVLAATRPTAQNLFYAIRRVTDAVRGCESVAAARRAADEAAQAIADEDAASCAAIGQHGHPLFRHGTRVLTHCNAGWLAFVDWGSALAPVYAAYRAGKELFVFVDETRPWNQGARLTAFELGNEHVAHVLIADNASGLMMFRKEVDIVIVGSDRIAANGDVANKIGTFEKAVVAHELAIPFYVAAPTSTIDPNCASYRDIPIEERNAEEVLYCNGILEDGQFGRVRVAAPGVKARNPSFDVTPAKYISGIITQRGIFAPEKILDALKPAESTAGKI